MVDDQQCSKSNLTSLTMNCMLKMPSMRVLTGQQSCHNLADEYLCVSCNGNSIILTAEITRKPYSFTASLEATNRQDSYCMTYDH